MTTSAASPLAATAHGSYRLAQVANFLTATSGGLGGVVQAIGQAHIRSGGPRLLVTPASRGEALLDRDEARLTVRSPALPGSAGQYHVMIRRAPVTAALSAFRPELIEIHDQTTLAWVARWAHRHAIPTALFPHEQLPTVAAQVTPGLPHSWTDALTGRWLARLARSVDAVVCASAFAARPYQAAGAANVHRVPLGVDLALFRPQPHRGEDLPWSPGSVRLIQVARLYPEKRHDLSLDALAVLRARGTPAELLVVGAGPREQALRATAARMRLPVHFLGRVVDRALLARLTASADVALCPGPRETFGLAVLEAMAAGTPVVTSDRGAAPELLAPGAGLTARDAREVADAVVRLVRDSRNRQAARRRAEQFSWTRTLTRLRELELTLMDRPGRARP